MGKTSATGRHFGDYYDGLFAMQLPVSAVRTSDLTEKLMSHTTVVDGVEYICGASYIFV